MTALFRHILDASLAGSIVILMVIVMHFLLRKAPKRWSYLLWIAPALRLIYPVGLTVPVVLQGSVPVTGNGPFTTLELGKAVQEAITVPVGGNAIQEAARISWVPLFLSLLWASGFLLLLTYGVIRYIQMKRRVEDAVITTDGAYESNLIDSPFILGLLRPRIYLPSGLPADTLACILAHEKVHLARKDHWIKVLAALLVAVHWFNPLVWAAFYWMSRDMEMSCDEAVFLRQKEDGMPFTVKAYSAALLSIACEGSKKVPSLLAFGESNIKRRIINVLEWKKPTKVSTLLFSLLCILFITGCMVHPQGKEAQVSLDERMDAMRVLCGMQEKEALEKMGADSSALVSTREVPYGDGSSSRTVKQYDFDELQLIFEISNGKIDIVTVNLYCKDKEELIAKYHSLDQTLKETCQSSSVRPYNYQTEDGKLIQWSFADRSSEAVGGKEPEGPLYILQYKEARA